MSYHHGYGGIDVTLGGPAPVATSPLVFGQSAGEDAQLTAARPQNIEQPHRQGETFKRKAYIDHIPTWHEALTQVWDHLPDFLLPLGIYAIIVLTHALFVKPGLSTLCTLVCFIVSIGLAALSRGRVWLMMSVICVAAILLAIAVDCYTDMAYLREVELLENSRWYSNVLADESPVAKKDASLLTFSAESFVDVSRAVGYRQGKLYCAAPVVTNVGQVDAGYWAVGTDCCKERSFFYCGDILNSTVKSSVVALASNPVASHLISKYETAAEMAATTYGMSLMNNATFVYWMEDTASYINDLKTHARVVSITSVLSMLIVTVVCAIAVPVAGIIIVGNWETFPYPEEVEKMQIGFQSECFQKRQNQSYDVRQLEEDLLEKRACWSGSVYHDYVFHLCNNTMFLGIIGCHPLHPYAKWERLFVAVIVSLLIVFPVAVITLQLPEDGWLHMLTIAIMVTAPRNIVKYYLFKVSIQDEEYMIEGQPGTGRRERAARALVWEAIVMTMIAFCTALLCFVSVGWIRDLAPGEPVGSVLSRQCNGLVYAFILEILFDLLIPHVAPPHLRPANQRTVWMIGFFGRWILENDRMARERARLDDKSLLRRVRDNLARTFAEKAGAGFRYVRGLDAQSAAVPPIEGFAAAGAWPPGGYGAAL